MISRFTTDPNPDKLASAAQAKKSITVVKSAKPDMLQVKETEKQVLWSNNKGYSPAMAIDGRYEEIHTNNNVIYFKILSFNH